MTINTNTKRTHNGEVLYSTGPIEQMMKQFYKLQRFRDEHQAQFETITPREIEVLALIAEGMNNSSIATKLNITRATIQNHRAQLRCKLQIKNETDFVKYAMAFDLIKL